MRIHDLTLPVRDGTAAGFGLSPASVRLSQPASGRGWWATEMRFPSHIGTPVDAPRHWLPDGGTVDKLDLSALIGPAIVPNLEHRPDAARITADDLAVAAGVEGVPRWLLATGWNRTFGTPEYYSEYYSSYPSLVPEAAEWLVGRGVRLLGVDMPSLSRIANPEVHRTLLAAGVIVVEGLCGLSAYPFQ